MAVIDKFLGDVVCADIDAISTEIRSDDFIIAFKRFIVIVLEVYDVEIRNSDLVPCQVSGIKKAIMVK